MELEFIRWLREHVPADPRAKLGLRDDAALLSLVGNPNIVVTTDLLTDGVDFRVGIDDLQRIGRQALGANLSDLAAMAANTARRIHFRRPAAHGASRNRSARNGHRPVRRHFAARSRIRHRNRRRRHQYVRRPARDQRHRDRPADQVRPADSLRRPPRRLAAS